MIGRIRRWGNSLGLRIPRNVSQELRLEEGAPVDLQVKDGHLVVSPVRARQYRLEDLLAGITPNNVHGEIETGDPVGGEAW